MFQPPVSILPPEILRLCPPPAPRSIPKADILQPIRTARVRHDRGLDPCRDRCASLPNESKPLSRTTTPRSSSRSGRSYSLFNQPPDYSTIPPLQPAHDASISTIELPRDTQPDTDPTRCLPKLPHQQPTGTIHQSPRRGSNIPTRPRAVSAQIIASV